MFGSDYVKVSEAAAAKASFLKRDPLAYFVLSLLAGIYIGFGVLLVFTLGGALQGAVYTKLVMGATFAVALSLVIIAGAELFTGNNFVMTAGMLKKTVSLSDSLRLWCLCWIGNLCGALILSLLFQLTGLYGGATLSLMTETAAAKMSAGFMPLLTRGILCNTLVCLAVWCGFRASSEAGKLIMVFWCILAFFATGFEHSIANMTLLSLALINNGGNEAISFGGYCFNLAVVTAGNMIGAIVLVAIPYYISSRKK